MTAGRVFIALVAVAAIVISMRSGRVQEVVPEEKEEPVNIEDIHIQTTDEMPSAAYADTVMLCKIMMAESGPNWPDWAIMCIGEVVLNRVASPEWPDTIHDVLYQAGPPIQYEPVWSDGWDELEPVEKYMDLARRLLAGERPMGDPDVVWQALFPQGSRTVVSYHDRDLDTTTYFCK